ncbi:MAG: peptidylprolyl isomerase [Bacillota bacterium]
MRKKLSLMFVALLLVFLLVGGCAKSAEIVAEVNGVKITKTELDQKVAYSQESFEASGYQFVGEEGEQMLSFIKMEVLNQLITEVIINEEAKKFGIAVSAAEVDNTLEQIKAPYGDELFGELLKQEGLTVDQFKIEIKQMLLQEGLFEKVTADVVINEEQIENFYQEHKDNLVEYRASHILIRPDEEMEDRDAADKEAKEKAIAIIKELDGGADFEELAKMHSADGSAAVGGDLGQYFTKGDSPYVPEFTAGAVILGKGEYSKEPVESFFGYHIIKITDKREGFEELRPSVEAILEREIKNEKFNDYFGEVMDKANVVNHLEK